MILRLLELREETVRNATHETRSGGGAVLRGLGLLRRLRLRLLGRLRCLCRRSRLEALGHLFHLGLRGPAVGTAALLNLVIPQRDASCRRLDAEVLGEFLDAERHFLLGLFLCHVITLLFLFTNRKRSVT